MNPAFNKEAKPNFESQGSNFFHGVKFSVQTTSLGKAEYLK